MQPGLSSQAIEIGHSPRTFGIRKFYTACKRSHAVDPPDWDDLTWLKEVHSKIWNRKDLKPNLFRKVELTYAYHVALQKSPEEAQRGSRLDELQCQR